MIDKTTRTGHWGQERRLEFIDFRLLWEGRLNRADITEFFRISVPQASLDLAKYQEIAPGNMVYDRTQKHTSQLLISNLYLQVSIVIITLMSFLDVKMELWILTTVSLGGSPSRQPSSSRQTCAT